MTVRTLLQFSAILSGKELGEIAPHNGAKKEIVKSSIGTKRIENFVIKQMHSGNHLRLERVRRFCVTDAITPSVIVETTID